MFLVNVESLFDNTLLRYQTLLVIEYRETPIVLTNGGGKLFNNDGSPDEFGKLAILHNEIEKKNLNGKSGKHQQV